MVDNTRVKFDVPIGTWGHTEVEVEYPWHRDLDSIILPLLESAHEAQAERQRKHRSDNSQHAHKSHSKSKRASAKGDRQESTLPARPNEDIKIFFKGFESAKDVDMKRGDTFQNVLEQYAQQAEKDVERLELFYKGRHAGRGMTPDSGSRTVRNCKSMSSFSSSSESSRNTRSRIARGKQRANTGTIYVANGIDEMLSAAPPRGTRQQHMRSSDSSSNSDRARQMLDIESAFEDIPPPMESAWTQPGPSRRVSHYRTRSIASDKALTVLGIEDYPLSEYSFPPRIPLAQRGGSDATAALPPVPPGGRSLIITPLSPLGSNPPNDLFLVPSSDNAVPTRSRHRRQSTQSSEKARRMLGFDQPDRRPHTQAGPPFDSIDAGSPPLARKHHSDPERYAEIEPRHDRSRSIATESSGFHPKLTTTISGPGTSCPQITEMRPRDSWMPPCVIANQETVERAVAADKRASVIASTVRPPTENIQYEVERKRANLCRRCPRMSGFLQSAAEAVC